MILGQSLYYFFCPFFFLDKTFFFFYEMNGLHVFSTEIESSIINLLPLMSNGVVRYMNNILTHLLFIYLLVGHNNTTWDQLWFIQDDEGYRCVCVDSSQHNAKSSNLSKICGRIHLTEQSINVWLRWIFGFLAFQGRKSCNPRALLMKLLCCERRSFKRLK